MSGEKDILGGRGREGRDVGWEGREEEEKLFTYLYLFISFAEWLVSKELC